MKLSTFLIVAFVVLSIVSTTFITYYLFLNSDKMLTNEVYDHLTTAAQSRANHIKTYLSEEKKVVEVMADSAVVRNLLTELSSGTQPLNKDVQDVQTRLNGLLRISKDYNEVFVLDKSGVIIASSNKTNMGMDKSRDLIFINGRNGTYVKDLYLSNVTQKPAISISSPIFDKQKNFIGVFAIRFYLDSLTSITEERSGLGETGEIELVNMDKYPVTPLRYRNDSVLSFKIDTELVNKCIDDIRQFEEPNGEIKEYGENIIHFKDYRGVDVIWTNAYIQPEMKWCLIAKIDESEALGEPMDDLTGVSLLTGIAALVFVSVVTLFISRKITGQIRKLRSNVEAITKGNLDLELGKSSISEVQDLTDSLNRILASLKLAILRTGMSKEDIGLGEAIRAKKEAELKYKTIVDVVPSAIFTVDLNKNITSWNKEAEKITGYTAEEMVGQSCLKFAVEPCGTKCGLYSKDVKKPIIGRECTIRTKGGQMRTVIKNVAELKDADGKVGGGIESFQDISDQKKADDDLRKRKAELERFANLSIGRELEMKEMKKRMAELEKSVKKK